MTNPKNDQETRRPDTNTKNGDLRQPHRPALRIHRRPALRAIHTPARRPPRPMRTPLRRHHSPSPLQPRQRTPRPSHRQAPPSSPLRPNPSHTRRTLRQKMLHRQTQPLRPAQTPPNSINTIRQLTRHPHPNSQPATHPTNPELISQKPEIIRHKTAEYPQEAVASSQP